MLNDVVVGKFPRAFGSKDFSLFVCWLDKYEKTSTYKYCTSKYCRLKDQTNPCKIILKVHPPIKLKSKRLFGSSLNFTIIKIVLMRPPILNFKSISQFWQSWARNRQHCGSKIYAFINNPTPPTVFEAHSSNFAQTLKSSLQRASRSRIFYFCPWSIQKKSKIFIIF